MRTASTVLLLLCLAAGLAESSAATEPVGPVLIRDVNPSTSQGSSTPSDPAGLGELAVFTAADPIHGRELWATDATAGGTRRLADLCPGACSTGVATLWVADERYFFMARPDAPHLPEDDVSPAPLGRDLWTTDGTPEGTRLLGSFDGVVTHIASLEPAGVHLFSARDAEHGAEPWRTDGTREGTWRLGDFFTGPGDAFDPYCFGAAVLDDRVLLALESPETGCEIWRSDGSSTGTTIVRDIEPGALSSRPSGFATVGDRVLFLATEQGHGTEMFVTDGTRTGTRRLLELAPGEQSTLFHSIATGLTFGVEGTTAHFLAGTRAVTEPETGAEVGIYELWRTDGTAAGTRRLTSFGQPFAFRRGPYDRDFQYFFLERFLALDSTVYFAANDGLSGHELWVSEGSPETARRLRDLCPGACSSYPMSLSQLGPDGGHGFSFVASDGVHGREVWTSDGTASETHLVGDLCEGDCDSVLLGNVMLDDVRVAAIYTLDDGASIWALGASPAKTRELERFDGSEAFAQGTTVYAPMARAGDMAVFPVTDELVGRELWATAGAPSSTRLLVDTVGEIGEGSNARGMVSSGAGVFFLANDGTLQPEDHDVWITDGSAAGTHRLPGAPHDCPTCNTPSIRKLHAAGGLIFYWVDGGVEGYTLWRSDGSPAGTFPLTGGHASVDLDFVAYRGAIYFRGGTGLWRTDGTPEGTEEVVGGELIEGPRWLTVHREHLYFGAWPARGRTLTLWRTDGSAAGTHVVMDGLRLVATERRSFSGLGDRLFFVASDDETGAELWATDGTAAGTGLVVDSVPGPVSGDVRLLGSLDDRALFETRAAEGGFVLRATDGTPAGTRSLGSFVNATGSHEVLTIDGRRQLLFAGHDPTHGRELWITDGRPAGTRLVKDLFPGPAWSDPTHFTAAGDLLFFQAFGRGHGHQIWRTDGRPDGTWQVTSIAQGVVLPEQDGSMALLADRLVFAGVDLEHGREPRSLPLDAGPVEPTGPGGGSDPPPPAGAWLASDATPGFRFKVRISQGAAGSIAGAAEPICIPETLCVSGALPGRSEVFLRVVGPRPNGKLWPTMVKFTTSEVEVWIEQIATGVVRHYGLEGASPGVDELTGLFDRDGFDP